VGGAHTCRFGAVSVESVDFGTGLPESFSDAAFHKESAIKRVRCNC